MTPTSDSLLLCTIALALLSAGATALLWNRMRGRRAARVAQRGALLLFGELMAATAILVWVNISNGGLVVSWQDLLGNQSTRGGVFAGQAGAVRLDPAPVPVARAAADEEIPAAAAAAYRAVRFSPSAGGFQEATFRGPASGLDSQVYVWTPPQYATEPHAYFPVLELLHGVVGSPDGWIGPMNVVEHLEAAEQSAKVYPFILVVPSVTPVPGHVWPWDNEECSNVPGDGDVDSWLTQDVRDVVTSDFRAEPAADGWGLMGYSTGGFCAAKLVLQHPDRYQAAVSLAGYYTPDSDTLTADTALDHANSPLWLLGHGRTPAVSLLMTASEQDHVDPAAETAQVLATAKANPRARATEVQSFVAPLGGGHNQSAWEKMLPTAFTWLSQRLTGPTT
ncbi:alpha/beta hydrolase [Actinospica robiniae]|uniref:alpha/beta hydrolase n=1 Tax=Actinospica robiniae TaxID=304901 RepID=UPI00054E28E2|nr:alpha/beta hydrolase-fold protein [Actinospica robiniae]